MLKGVKDYFYKEKKIQTNLAIIRCNDVNKYFDIGLLVIEPIFNDDNKLLQFTNSYLNDINALIDTIRIIV